MLYGHDYGGTCGSPLKCIDANVTIKPAFVVLYQARRLLRQWWYGLCCYTWYLTFVLDVRIIHTCQSNMWCDGLVLSRQGLVIRNILVLVSCGSRLLSAKSQECRQPTYFDASRAPTATK